MQQLPNDLLTAHQKIIDLYGENKHSKQEIANLRRELEYVKEQLRLTRARIFGRSSEKRPVGVSPSQTLLFSALPTVLNPNAKKQKIEYTRNVRQNVEGKLPEGTRFPDHLPRKDEIIDEGEGEVEFEKITERLATNGTPFYVKRIIRRIRSKDGSLASPPVPPAVIERTSVDVSFLSYILVAKYVWHLPLYRQEQILKAQGINISRDTLIRYVITLAELLKPIYVALGVLLFSGEHLFGDETPIMVGKLSGNSKKYSQSRFWAFLGKAGCVFYHTPTRAYKEVEPLLKSFSGHLQTDGYTVYEKVSREYPEITIVSCWAHVRRKFVDAEKGGNAPEVSEALRYIRALYRVETRIRDGDLKPPEILHLRKRYSKKILKLFEAWLKKKAEDPSLLPKSLFATAVGYTRKRFAALCLYIDNANLAIDSNAIEREIRPVALGKKNWLFCASETGAEASAIIYSLVASCRLAGVDPFEYFNDVLERISVHPASKIDDLIPANWKFLKNQENSVQG